MPFNDRSHSPSPIGLTQRGRLAFLLKDSVLYGAAAAFNKAFSLVTFPLLARHFTVSEYGALDYFMILAGLLAIVFVFGQDSAVARFFYETEDLTERRQLISQSLAFQFLGLVIFIPCLWWNAKSITPWLITGEDRYRLLQVVLLQVPFLLLVNFTQNILKWTFARAPFLIVTVGSTIVQMCLLLLGVRWFALDTTGVLWVSLITHALFAALGLFFVREWLIWPSHWNHLRQMLPFAIPLGLICIVGAFSPTLERSLTDNLLGTDSLGMYAAAAKVAMLIGLLVSSFQTAWGPFSLSLYKDADAGLTYNSVLQTFVLGACAVSLIISGLSHSILTILAGPQYGDASIVVFPLVLSLAIQATSWITEIGIGISKRSYLNLYSYAASLLATLAGIGFLTPWLGLVGVGIGVLIGQIVKAVVASTLAQIAYPLPWSYRPVVAAILLTLLTGFVATWLRISIGESVAMGVHALGLIAILLVNWRTLRSVMEVGKRVSKI
ncbi:MAG: oligosaccharide flippase family protein [Planctomycetaceae bacterium]|nr:oligosaccharide flippase family protein [Planctomycetaceae bacterium]